MKQGDLVEFRSGLFGIDAPQNVGLYLERTKKGKQFFAVLWTVKGRKEVLTDHLKGVRVSSKLDDVSEETLRSRLQQLLGEGASKPRAADATGDLSDRDLWRFVSGREEPLSPQAVAEAWHKGAVSRKQVEDARNVLATCARPGVGYFERVPGREELWRALPPLAYKQVRQEIEGFQALRRKLVTVEEVDDPETGRPRTLLKPIPREEWDLGASDLARLAVLKEFMASFVLHDRDTGLVGLPNDAGFLVHTIDGFRLSELARWLAVDWTGARGVSLSSAYTQFLVDAGLWTLSEAIVEVAKRRVLAVPDFGWEVAHDAIRAAERCKVEIAQGPEPDGRVAVRGPDGATVLRRDLRALPAWTIDPADAKDHDDAVSYEPRADGSATLWVHIADVSHFVERGSTLDHHARKRATSVYLPTGVLPMLPPRLSDDLCSLNAGEDKLALTAEIVYGPDCEVREARFHEAVVRIAANVSYDEVDAAILRGEEPFASIEAFARRVGAKRRGLPIETSEIRVRVGTEITHAKKSQTRATKMIEVFMVAANEAVARALRDASLPCLYRCHPLPDRAGVERFNAQMATMELDVAIELPTDGPAKEESGASILDLLKGGKLEIRGGGFLPVEGPGPEAAPAAPPPALRGLAQLAPEEQEAWLSPFRSALAKVEALRDERLREIVYVKSLSCMGRAFYTPANLGHFGLGSTCYAHFTSPIRRYPDLVVHRQLRAWMRGEEAPHGDDLADLAVHCSEQGGAAEDVERGVVASTLVFLSREETWGGAVEALVNGVTRGGLFLSLPDGLEARVSASDVPGGPWSVDEHESMLFREAPPEDVTGASWRELWNEDLGASVHVRARLGDRLPVVLAGRDFVEGRIAAKLADGSAR